MQHAHAKFCVRRHIYEWIYPFELWICKKRERSGAANNQIRSRPDCSSLIEWRPRLPPSPAGRRCPGAVQEPRAWPNPGRGVPSFWYNGCWAQLCWPKDCGVQQPRTPGLRNAGFRSCQKVGTQLTSTFNWLKAMPHSRNTKNPCLESLWSKEYYGRSI